MTEVDIVRQLHGAADRAGLVCTKTGNFRAAMIDAGHLRAAADEIERLRARCKALEEERDAASDQHRWQAAVDAAAVRKAIYDSEG